MCTAVIRVPSDPSGEVHVLAVRDEDPHRPWLALDEAWPDTQPGVIGVRDARAGGAWLAADPEAGRFAVLLNRADISPRHESELRSRGMLPLASVAGRALDAAPATHGFNLVEVDGCRARVASWDGHSLRVTELEPGTHMIAHDDVNDPRTARVAQWREAFAEADTADWIDVLAGTTEVGSTDDRAIIRDNRPFGYPTQSLLVCTASVTAHGAAVSYAELDEPGRWNAIAL